MPLHVYVCPSCGSTTEQIVPWSAIPEAVPCDCGADAPRVRRADFGVKEDGKLMRLPGHTGWHIKYDGQRL